MRAPVNNDTYNETIDEHLQLRPVELIHEGGTWSAFQDEDDYPPRNDSNSWYRVPQFVQLPLLARVTSRRVFARSALFASHHWQ